MPTSDQPALTLARPAHLLGTGVFTSLDASMTIAPAPAGRGVWFRRTDARDSPSIAAHTSRVVNRPRHTVLGELDSPVLVETVEHVMGALAGLGVTDALIEMNAAETPLMDGSAIDFCRAILDAGLSTPSVRVPESATTTKTATATATATTAAAAATPNRRNGHESPFTPRRPLVVTRVVELTDEFGTIRAEPCAAGATTFEYHLDYGPNAPIRKQSATFVLNHAAPDRDAFSREIAPARTFCTLAEANQMRSLGLFKHLKPADVLVIGPDGPVDTTLRFDNEPARHKVLDMIGDLALAARPIQARIIAHKTGHAMNHALTKRLLQMFGQD